MAGGGGRNGEVLLDLFLKLDAIAPPLVSLFYPAFSSWNAIKSKSTDLMCKWLTYWVAYAVICMFECIFGPFEWLPLWRYMKLMATGWLAMPWFDGVTQIRENVIGSFSAEGATTFLRDNFNESVSGGRSAVAGLMSSISSSSSTNRVHNRRPFAYDHHAAFYNRHQSKREVIPEHHSEEDTGPAPHQNNGEKVEAKRLEPTVEIETRGDHQSNGPYKISKEKKYATARRERYAGRKPPETNGHQERSFIRWQSGKPIQS